MLIVLNGYPGVGKLTIAQALAPLLGARLLDNHTVYNLAFALTEFKSPEFYDAVRAVQKLADDRIAALPEDVPLVMTEVLTGTSPWAVENWNRIERLAAARGPLHVVHVRCDLDENRRRIAASERLDKRKPVDPAYADRNQTKGAALLGADAARLLRLDVTTLTADAAARRIFDWVHVP